MIAIDMETPKSCCEFHKDTGMVIHCPLYNFCDKRTTVRVNFKPIDCPLAEIVTCKDCKHWVKELTPRVPDTKEYHFCPMMDCNTAEDFYCADGERRE